MSSTPNTDAPSDLGYWQQRAQNAEAACERAKASLEALLPKVVGLGHSLAVVEKNVTALEDAARTREQDRLAAENDLATAVHEAHQARQAVAIGQTALGDANATIAALRAAQTITAGLVGACLPLVAYDRPPTKQEIAAIRRAARALHLHEQG